MKNNLSVVGAMDVSTRVISLIVFVSVSLFLVVKSAHIVGGFIIALYALSCIVTKPSFYLAGRTKTTWVLFGCLISPFLLELIVQLLRAEVVARSLDGPSRWVLFSVIFLFISRRDCSPILRALVYGSGLGILLTTFSLFFAPEQYWGLRAATYFVDPITLPTYTVAMLAAVLFFSLRSVFSPWAEAAVKAILIVCTIFIAFESSSRTSWIGLIVILVCFILFTFRHSFRRQLVAVSALFCLIFLAFYVSDVLGDRARDAFSGVYYFLTGDPTSDLRNIRGTSSGQRLVIFLIDLELLKESWLLGTADGLLPSFSALISKVPQINEEIYWIRDVAGTHSEYMASLVRQGLIFGSGTLFLFFVVPCYFAVSKRSFLYSQTSFDSVVILSILVTLMVCGVGIQLFNLKMTISYFILCVTLLYSQISYVADLKIDRSKIIV